MTASDSIEIVTATERDLDGILALQEDNQPEHGGTLSAQLSRTQIRAMLTDLPLMVARRGTEIVGYLLAASKPTVAEVPVIRAMLAAYAGKPHAYVYGPIVVAEVERGRGLAQRLFESLRSRLPGREGILFIRADNSASLRAHEKMGVVPRGTFRHNDRDFVVLPTRDDRGSCRISRAKPRSVVWFAASTKWAAARSRARWSRRR